MSLKTTAIVFAAALSVLPAFAQDEAVGKQEVSVMGFGNFLKSTTQNGIRNEADNTGGVLASYRYFFNQHHGVEVNYGFSSYTQSYGTGLTKSSLDNRSHEISAAYVYRVRTFNRITPFAEAGVGGVVFDPKNYSGASSEARAAFVYGGGADITLSSHLFLRGEYRGLVYNSPTWGLSALHGYDRVTHAAEPAVGIGWRF